ncbi:unnamed protein product [Lota lota]
MDRFKHVSVPVPHILPHAGLAEGTHILTHAQGCGELCSVERASSGGVDVRAPAVSLVWAPPKQASEKDSAARRRLQKPIGMVLGGAWRSVFMCLERTVQTDRDGVRQAAFIKVPSTSGKVTTLPAPLNTSLPSQAATLRLQNLSQNLSPLTESHYMM